MDVNTKRGEEATPQSLESLVAELGIEVSTADEIRRERSRLERALHLRYGIHPSKTRHAIATGEIPEDDLVAEWLTLDALLQTAEEPKERGRPRSRASRHDESRESGSFAFRVCAWLRRA